MTAARDMTGAMETVGAIGTIETINTDLEGRAFNSRRARTASDASLSSTVSLDPRDLLLRMLAGGAFDTVTFQAGALALANSMLGARGLTGAW
jgi:hypothetical protein